MKKILLVFDTRPEAIKMAPLVKEFQKYPKKFAAKVCVTGQHRQMLDQVLEVFDIQLNYDLNIMAPNQDLYDITSKVLLVMRDTTERPETVEAGTVKLEGTDASAIVENMNRLLNDKTLYDKMSQAHNSYEDEKTCERIVNFSYMNC